MWLISSNWYICKTIRLYHSQSWHDECKERKENILTFYTQGDGEKNVFKHDSNMEPVFLFPFRFLYPPKNTHTHIRNTKTLMTNPCSSCTIRLNEKSRKEEKKSKKLLSKSFKSLSKTFVSQQKLYRSPRAQKKSVMTFFPRLLLLEVFHLNVEKL